MLGNHLCALKGKGKKHTDLAEADILRLLRYWGMMIKQNHHKTLQELETAAKAVLEHLFNDHSKCGDWCRHVQKLTAQAENIMFEEDPEDEDWAVPDEGVENEEIAGLECPESLYEHGLVEDPEDGSEERETELVQIIDSEIQSELTTNRDEPTVSMEEASVSQMVIPTRGLPTRGGTTNHSNNNRNRGRGRAILPRQDQARKIV